MTCTRDLRSGKLLASSAARASFGVQRPASEEVLTMEEPQARFERDDEAELPRLVVTGEIDLGVAGTFASELKQLVGDAHSPAVVDLTGVTFFNSTGISVLSDAVAEARRRRVELVVRPSSHVRRTLEITGL